MCGIAGAWSRNIQHDYAVVNKILKAQHHRGPDNRDITSVNGVTLGHNRLAIIDLTDAANQPFKSVCGRYVIVFNGEIYNYLELKKNLDYPFITSSDTEVLLAAYIQFGTACLANLNGMFAFAIYDLQQDLLFCARDRVGKKPFVYSEHHTGFYFSSELSALFSTGVFSSEADDIGLGYSQLRNFRHIPEPYTRYKAIRRLEPAHAMLIRNQKIEKKWCYWAPSCDYDTAINTDDVFSTIDNAVRLRERSDVEIATLLSGGVDSSIITGLMVNHGLKPKAFCLKSDDEELGRARLVAEQFNVPLQVFHYDKELQEKLYAQMTAIYGEEVRLLPLTHAARLYQVIASENIKVVMTGIGADEIFYGYDGANRQLLFSDMVKFLEVLPKKLLRTFEVICSSSHEFKLLFQLAALENSKRKGFLYAQEAQLKGLDNYDYNLLLDSWAERVITNSYIDSANWLGLITENAHSITISSDLPAMMFGIETRAPFLDHNVIELALRIDAHRKISKLHGRPNNKLILKKAFADLLPKEILNASKKGFGYGVKHDLF